MAVYTIPNPAPLLQCNMMSLGLDPIVTVIGCDGSRHPISGGDAPILGAQEGVNVGGSIRGLMAPFKHLDQQSARQDGVTWQDSVYDPMELDFLAELYGKPGSGYRGVQRRWMDAFSPLKQSRVCWFTPEMGEWWANTRLLKNFDDEWKMAPSQTGHSTIAMALRTDEAFWTSFDSVDDSNRDGWAVTSTSSSASGFMNLNNRGNIDGHPRHLLYGPGTFYIGDGPLPVNTVKFGPLHPGQIVMLTTNIEFKGVTDLSATSGIPQDLPSLIKTGLAELMNFAANGNGIPLVKELANVFGWIAPQGNLYSLLDGRFDKTLPPGQSWVPVRWEGGNSSTRVVSAVTPFRTWPE